MSRSAIHFQKGLSLPEFQRLYGTEEQCVVLGLLLSSSSSGEGSLARWVPVSALPRQQAWAGPLPAAVLMVNFFIT